MQEQQRQQLIQSQLDTVRPQQLGASKPTRDGLRKERNSILYTYVYIYIYAR